MILPRDYTLADIDAMRKAVTEHIAKDMGLTPRQISLATVENRLRTYMVAGVTLADLRGGVVREPDPFEENAE